eukprot:TRINITY_DN70553_c0_g1_i1.p1 TRINITY_DN70553_c0_g1~~TRINITY_DN70553_c0_g1_i1.p1  ORF type:complete len:246 (+),score=35.65 TRINITY_DN70553_c0_g1_i1:100-738(+)
MGISPSQHTDADDLREVLHPHMKPQARPGAVQDTDNPASINYGRQGRRLLPETQDPNDIAANSMAMDRQQTTGPAFVWVKILPGQPHYSKIEYPVDFRDMSGRPKHYGLRPWRCGDRVLDMFLSVCQLKFNCGPGLLWKCAWSEPGQEPVDPYKNLSRNDVEYFAERRQRQNIRNGFWERYPWPKLHDPVPPPPYRPRNPIYEDDPAGRGRK